MEFFAEHFIELQQRCLKTVIIFVLVFLSYCLYSKELYGIIVGPCLNLAREGGVKFIYTNLTEVFFSYLKLAFVFSVITIIPMISWHIYKFVAPGLYAYERFVLKITSIMMPILFFTGIILVYFFVMPIAWKFFLSFEESFGSIHMEFNGKVSEYVDLTLSLMMGFGFAFELPLIIIVLNVIGIVDINSLVNFRRFAIVIILTLAAVLTPPDVISQIILFVPLYMLYEISIIICRRIEQNRLNNA